MKGILDDILAVVMGLVLLFITLAIVIVLIFSAQSGSTCWGNTLTEVGKIQSSFNELSNVGDTKLVFVSLESCVDGIVFINKDQFYKVFSSFDKFDILKNELNCVDNFDAFIIASPRIQDGPSFVGVLGDFALYDDSSNARKWSETFIRDKTGLKPKPICKNVPVNKAVFDAPSINEVPNLGGKFCITIKRLTEFTYTILSFQEVGSKEQCIPPST